jgi:hypothetical protein
MLRSVLIENFFSVAERQELVFLVPANVPDLPCFRESPLVCGRRLPLVVGLFGPNASGKSTVLRAITATAEFVRHSFTLPPDSSIPVFNPFARGDWMSRSTVIIIEWDGRLAETAPAAVFRYELHIGNEPKRFAGEVSYESLSHAPQGRFHKLFEREGQVISLGREFAITNGDPRVRSIRPNASVVSTLAQFNHKPSSDLLASVQGLITNLAGLVKVDGWLPHALSFYAQHPDHLRRLNRELNRFDLGLEEMSIHPGSAGPTATFKHLGLDSRMGLGQESEGTLRFVEVFPFLQTVLDRGGLAVIDDLDIDIHPLLLPEVLRWFYDRQRNPKGAQLLFTAHNPAILDELEKEQVFFCEKPCGKATRVYGARQIKGLRRGPSLARKYLAGELGAVPHIG